MLESHEGRGRLDTILDRVRTLQPVAAILSSADLLGRLRAPLRKRYKVERELGRGGMAIVFLAEDVKHRRKVALKILRPELTSDFGNARFLKEIGIVAQLTHPHILPLHDSGEVAGLLYYVMPYVEGESLRDRLTREGQLGIDDALRISREVADALTYAHSHDVIHRDIKPENILLESGHAVVSDFGIARAMTAAGGDDLTEAAIALGTPAYMSPEQSRGDPNVDGRTDVYSLGCLLHEMLRGEPPFSGATVADVLDQHLRDAPPEIPGLPAAAASAIRRALAKEPAERFPSAAEFEKALARAAAEASPATRRQRRRSATLVGAVLVVAAVIATTLAPPRSPLPPALSVVAVLPLIPVARDSGLARLGRDLVVTLSASLDGVSELRTVDALTILAQTLGSDTLPLNEGMRLARRLGATSVMHGTVARADSQVSVDMGVFAVDGGARIAHASRMVDPRNLTAVTDTLAWTLLREVWRTRAPPTPNLAAVTTRSLPALREFLDGERAALESRWDAAGQAYARAMRADSTFWLAYWRYAFARWWYLEAVDSHIIRALKAHRSALPERDRLVFESWVTDTFSVAIARSGEVVTRYPDYWPGWMQHADWLFHVGPVYGHDRAEAKAALKRTVVLNPALLPAWEHLYWVAIHDDTATAAEALAALERLGFARSSTAEFGWDLGRMYRFELALARSGTPDRRLADSIAVDLLTARGRGGSGATLAPAQIALSERVLRARPRPELASLHERLLADAWASRGAWDSAVVVADQYARRAAVSDPVNAYRSAVIGVWVGALPSEEAQRRRAVAARAVGRSGVNAMWRAELAWLDGLLASTLRDRDQLVAARERLRRTDTVSTALLDRTLGAFEAELLGERRLAAATLAATNWQNPDLLVPGYGAHPYVIAISRLAAARWLAAEGDTTEATRLLMWFEAEWALDGYRPARRVLSPLATLERARIAAAQGRSDQARREFATFVRRYDVPTRAHRRLVDEAQGALRR